MKQIFRQTHASTKRIQTGALKNCEGIKCEFYMVSPSRNALSSKAYLTRNLKYKKGDSNMLADTKSAHTLHFITIELLTKYQMSE